MSEVVLLSLASALSPTLVAVTAVMLLLPSPERLMLGCWLGAMIMSVTLGLIIVFTLKGSGLLGTSEHTLSPAADLALAAIAFGCGWALASGVDRRFGQRRAEGRKEKQPPKWRQALDKGSARLAFVVGVFLALPSASYLIGLDRLSKLDYPGALTVLIVIAFNLVTLLVLEVVILAFRFAPEQAPLTIERVKVWGGTHARTYGVVGLAVIGALLVLRGLVGLL